MAIFHLRNSYLNAIVVEYINGQMVIDRDVKVDLEYIESVLGERPIFIRYIKKTNNIKVNARAIVLKKLDSDDDHAAIINEVYHKLITELAEFSSSSSWSSTSMSSDMSSMSSISTNSSISENSSSSTESSSSSTESNSSSVSSISSSISSDSSESEESDSSLTSGGGLVATPLAEWPFTEGSGQIVADLQGYSEAVLGSNSGVDSGDAEWIAEGVDCRPSRFVTLANNGFGLFNKQSFTLGVVVRIPNFVANSIIWSYDFATWNDPWVAMNLRTHNTAGQLLMGWNNSGSLAQMVGATLAINTWYHVQAKFTSGAQRILVNGTITGSGAAAHTINYTNRGVWIGKDARGTSGDSHIAYAYFYDRFTADEEDSDNHAYLVETLAPRGIILPG